MHEEGFAGQAPTGRVIPLAAAYQRVIDLRDRHVAETIALQPVAADGGSAGWAPPHRPRAWLGGLALVCSDTIALVLSTVLGLDAVITVRLRGGYHPKLAVHLAFIPVFVASLAAYGLYRSRQRRIGPSGLHDIVDIGHALLVAGVCALALDAVVLRVAGRAVLSPEEVVAVCLLGMITVPLGRAAVAAMSSRRWMPRCRIAIVGSGRVADAVKSRLVRYPNIRVVAQVDDHPVDDSPFVDNLDRLRLMSDRGELDRVIVAFSQTPTELTLSLLRDILGSTPISIVPRLFELVSWRSKVDELYGLPMIDVAPRQRLFGQLFKRGLDVVVSGLLLLLTLPLFAAIALAIKLTSPGPVFFGQKRTGRWAKPFTIFKFRTMVDKAEQQLLQLVDNDVDGPLFKLRRDPRVTRVGGWLRTASLDELPQLINVFKGDMSLVGPRPFICKESDAIDGWARKRFEVRPGMTGLWQVSGRSELTFEDLRRLDYLYVSSWSLWWDLRILAQTPRSVMHRLGAY